MDSKQNPSISVIVTSYNQARTLRFLRASLERQTFTDFEVIIADDGSSDETETLCREKWTCPVSFVTQPDEGYRKSRIVNEGVRRSRADYLIFLDADVILEQHFLQDHWSLRQSGAFVCGRRVDLGPDFSRTISAMDVKAGKFDRLRPALLLSALRKDTQGLKRGLRLADFRLRKLLGYDRSLDLLGSNFGIWKADLLAVNGFNESMESYWGEDGDLFVRLRNLGKKSIGAKSMCIQYHVYHHRRTPTPDNVQWYRERLKDTVYRWAEKGIS